MENHSSSSFAEYPLLNQEAGVARLGGDQEFWVELLELLLEDSRGRIEMIREALAAGQLEEVCRQAHSIKGAAANVEAVRLRMVAKELEELSQNGDGAVSEQLFQVLASTLEELQPALEQFQSELA